MYHHLSDKLNIFLPFSTNSHYTLLSNEVTYRLCTKDPSNWTDLVRKSNYRFKIAGFENTSWVGKTMGTIFAIYPLSFSLFREFFFRLDGNFYIFELLPSNKPEKVYKF